MCAARFRLLNKNWPAAARLHRMRSPSCNYARKNWKPRPIEWLKSASSSGRSIRLAATLEQERQRLKAEEADKARLAKEQAQLSASLDQERQRLKNEEAEKNRLAKEQEQLRLEQSQLAANLEQERQRLKNEEAEKARLEKERAAKEEEIKRLTRTQEELTRSLQDEISKGNITIQQVRDRLTINMVDRVLFDSGQAVIKPAGVKVLKQVGDVLKKVTDKQIRIEGHTDNVPISVKLQDRFKTNSGTFDGPRNDRRAVSDRPGRRRPAVSLCRGLRRNSSDRFQ